MKHIIFYHPHPIVENPQKGSELRPKKMKEAFESIGYQVDLAVGDSRQRKAAFKRIKKNIKDGKIYNFMYAESSNMPIPLTDPHHLPLKPLLDYNFFRFLNKKSIPIGFFYRDLYWRDKEASREISFLKKETKQLFHWLEWFGIRSTVDHLFLPTTGMAKYLPNKWDKECLSALYPGCEAKSATNGAITKEEAANTELNLFYVGGIKIPYYDLRPMLKIVSKIDNVNLILCCRKKEWDEFSYYYQDLSFDSIEIVHADSTQIGFYYKKADLVIDLRSPIGYLKNTIPIKIIEAIGYEIPILLLEGTEYAEFVKRENTGWVVRSIEEAKELLLELQTNRYKIDEKVSQIRKINKMHTWEKRAEQASETLKNLGSL